MSDSTIYCITIFKQILYTIFFVAPTTEKEINVKKIQAFKVDIAGSSLFTRIHSCSH